MKNLKFFSKITALSRRILLLGALAASIIYLAFILYALLGDFSFTEKVALRSQAVLAAEYYLLSLTVIVAGAFLADVVSKERE